jgi:hypothetical protein
MTPRRALPKNIHNAVVTGLQKLLALRMPGTPAAGALQATAAVWIEALENANIAWDENLDTRRIEAAFASLIRHCEQWPQPAHFFHRLPARTYPPALGVRIDETTRRANAEKLKTIIQKFKQQHNLNNREE